MDCPWRRTFTSVFLLLSPHSVRVLSQNVMPTGPLPPLPFMRDPGNDVAGFSPGPYQQQMNLVQNAPSGLSDFVPFVPCATQLLGADQFRFGPPFSPGLFNPAVQNIGPRSQVPVGNIEAIANGPPLLDPVCNSPPNINVPAQQGTLSQSPFSFPPPLISLPPPSLMAPIPNIQSQGPPTNFLPVPLVSIPQVQNCSPPQIVNLPPPQGTPFPTVSSLSGPQCPLYPGPQAPSGCPGQSFIPPNTAALQNQNLQIYPTSFPQPSLPPALLNTQFSCSVPTEFTSVPCLPPPNIPPSISVQNYGPISPPYFQPPPLVPMDYFPMPPIAPVIVPSPNFQIAALPPVMPAVDIPQCYECNVRGSPQPPTEEYSPMPINLEINVPSPTVPEPKITVITAFASPPPTCNQGAVTDGSDISFATYPPPLPPLIIEGRRSSSRSWLPLFLIALFARDGFCDGGRSACCCPCNSGNADIPIPYPIPIPTNNPIILGSPRRSRKGRVKVEREVI